VEWVESAASTVEEAKDRALDDLGIDESDAEIEVLEEPRPGLFGRTRGKARIRARVKPRVQPPKQEGRGGRRSGGRSGRGSDDGSEARQTGGVGDATTTDGRSGPNEGRSPRRRRPRDGAKAAGPTEAPAGGGRSRQGAARARDPEGDDGRRHRNPTPPGAEQGETVETILSLDDHVASVEEFVSGLVDAFGLEATVEVVELEDDIREVRVVGDDLGLLIGPRGLTLQAVHELARTVVYRLAPDGQEGRVRIDIGGYRERRRGALERFTTTVAEGVRSSGQAKSLEPMAPPDRKVVHDVVNEIDGVRTISEGEEPRRRVVVLPEG